MKKVSVVVAFFVAAYALVPRAYASAPTPVWQKTFDTGGGVEDWANAVRIDPTGNIVVLGGSVVAPSENLFRLIKYDTAGAELMNKTYDPGSNCTPLGLAVDTFGNYFTTGGYNGDYFTIGWDGVGHTRFTKSFDAGGDEWAYAVACDLDGNSYVSGIGWVLVKYDPWGNVLWSKSFSTLRGSPYSAAVGPDGSIYVGGYSVPATHNEARILKFTPAADTLWSKTYGWDSTSNFINGITVDQQGYIYCTGISYVPPDGPGAIVTYQLKPNGTVLWQQVYNPGYQNAGYGIAVDDHFVYVVGQTNNGSGNDLIVLRYLKNGQPLTPFVHDWGGDDWFNSIATDNAGNFYVAGETNGDLHVVKYHQDDFAVAETRISKPALMLDARTVNRTEVTIRYALPSGATGTLSIFGLDGRLVTSFSLAARSSPLATGSLSWDARSYPAGIYFARLTSGRLSATRKVVVIK